MTTILLLTINGAAPHKTLLLASNSWVYFRLIVYTPLVQKFNYVVNFGPARSTLVGEEYMRKVTVFGVIICICIRLVFGAVDQLLTSILVVPFSGLLFQMTVGVQVWYTDFLFFSSWF